ncbi:MAG TPA: hypothetical protein VGS22_08250 [Thermoanaerobaculia bacterium]|jgi:hypothetical protein|nr:hypothetical protein [Thermoanaerobaculia bacterium]
MHAKLIFRSALILALFAVVAFCGNSVARATDLPLPDAPAISSQAPTQPDVPADGSGLFMPEPIPQCKAGWCSSTAQCQAWFGPDWVCQLGPGATCGMCRQLA